MPRTGILVDNKTGAYVRESTVARWAAEREAHDKWKAEHPPRMDRARRKALQRATIAVPLPPEPDDPNVPLPPSLVLSMALKKGRETAQVTAVSPKVGWMRRAWAALKRVFRGES